MTPEEQREFLRSLGILTDEEELAEDAQADYPDFDGGARQSAPLPSDPVGDHDETVLEIVQRTRWGSLGPTIEPQ